MTDDQSTELNADDVSALKEMAEWWRESGMSRRAVLGIAGGATLGAAASGGFLTGRATAQSQSAGNIGSASSPADAYLEDVYDFNGNPVMSMAGDGSIGSISVGEINNAYIPGRGSYATIQAAIDAIPTASSGTTLGDVGLGEVRVPSKEGSNSEGYEETVDVDENGITISGQGVNTLISGTGDHTVDLQATDVHVDNLWVDQADTSGSFDAINANDEAVLTRLDIDRAPRHGLNINHTEVQGSNIRILDFGILGRGISFGPNATDCEFSTLNIRGNNDNLDFGIVVEDGAQSIHIGPARVENTNDNAIFWAGDYGSLTAEVLDAGVDGVKLSASGDGNVMQLVVRNATNDALNVSGNASGNLIMGYFGGSVTLGPNTSNNVIIGRATGTVTDDGTGNDTTLLI